MSLPTDGVTASPESRPAPEWAAVVIASRESSEVLMRTLDALAHAAVRPLLVDVVINGNDELALACARRLSPRPALWPAALQLRVWSLALGDKAHAINTYVHQLWPGSPVSFFVDGYARVRPDALQQLATTLSAHQPEALAAAALPTSGRGAAAVTADLHTHGGLHGNLFALGAPALQTMRSLGFRLPLGLYRVDSTLAAALAFRLEPGRFEWAVKRNIVFAPQARWDVDTGPWWRPATWQAHARRRQRQAQGDLENWAVRHWLLLNRLPAEGLAPTVEALVQRWAQQDPEGFAARLQGGRRRREAWQRLSQPAPDRSAAATPPQLVIHV